MLGGAKPPRIRPFNAKVHFSRSCSANSWTGYVLHESRDIAYELVLRPEYDVNGELIGWELVLWDMSNSRRSLLEPTKPWHGLLPAFLVAMDFQSGPAKSGFGNERTFRLPIQGLMITMKIESFQSLTYYYCRCLCF
jgi:hypothetical protein